MKINGIILRNKESKSFTAFIKEYPGVMAQAKTIEEVKRKLDQTWRNFLDYSAKISDSISYSQPNDL